jgi:hypothetical protein
MRRLFSKFKKQAGFLTESLPAFFALKFHLCYMQNGAA